MEEPKKVLQWHPAMYAGIQVELDEEAGQLQFENEHQLGTKPMAVDILIIKNFYLSWISAQAGRIFKKTPWLRNHTERRWYLADCWG